MRVILRGLAVGLTATAGAVLAVAATVAAILAWHNEFRTAQYFP